MCCECGGGCDCDPALGPDECDCTNPLSLPYRKDFNSYDLNGNGFLEGNEISFWWKFKHCIWNVVSEIDCSRDATQLIDLYDTDMSENLSLAEFESVWSDAAADTIDWPADPVEIAFEETDYNDDGQLDVFTLKLWNRQHC